jgi:hypothetical protein
MGSTGPNCLEAQASAGSLLPSGTIEYPPVMIEATTNGAASRGHAPSAVPVAGAPGIGRRKLPHRERHS